jgi:hypothetical protein
LPAKAKEKDTVKKTVRKPSGQFAGGTSPGPGRPPGSRNKFSGDLKAHVLEALANALEGGDAVDYLIEQARQPNPSPFMSLIGKCIAQAVEGKVDATVDVRVSCGGRARR